MGVDQAQTPESQDSGSIPWELRDDDPFLVTYDHESDVSSSFNQNADLSPDFSREVTEETGQFRGNDPLRRNSPSVYVLQSSQLVRFQTDDVSVNSSDRCPPLF